MNLRSKVGFLVAKVTLFSVEKGPRIPTPEDVAGLLRGVGWFGDDRVLGWQFLEIPNFTHDRHGNR